MFTKMYSILHMGNVNLSKTHFYIKYKYFFFETNRRDFRAGLLDALPVAPLFTSRRLVVDVLWKSFRSADRTRSFGRNDILSIYV